MVASKYSTLRLYIFQIEYNYRMLPPAFNPVNPNFPGRLLSMPSNPSYSTSRCSQPLLWFRRNPIIVQWRQIGTKFKESNPTWIKYDAIISAQTQLQYYWNVKVLFAYLWNQAIHSIMLVLFLLLLISGSQDLKPSMQILIYMLTLKQNCRIHL